MTPQTGDTVTIINNSNVTLNVDPTIAGLTFTGGANANSLIHNGHALTVNGTVTMNQPTAASVTSTWDIGNGTATVSGLITLTGSNATVTRISKMILTSGQLNANGGITFGGTNGANATKVIDMSGGAGTLNLKGGLTFTVVGTLTAGSAGSAFNYADSATAQTVRMFAGGAYNNLYLNNTNASGVTLSAAITAANVTGDIRVQSGVLKNGGLAIAGNAGKTFEVANGAAFEMSAGAFPTGFGTFSLGNASTVRYLQNSALTLTSVTYGNLELKAAGTRTFTFPAGAFNVNGSLTIGNGSNACTAAANANATILSVGGDVIINAASVLSANSANPMTVGGNWTRTGTFTSNTSTVKFISTTGGNTLAGTMTGGTGRFYNLEFDGVGGDWTNTGALETNNNFTITNGTFTAGNAITVTGNWTNNDRFVHNNQTVTLNSAAVGKTLSGNLSGSGGRFYNLTFGGAGGWSASSTLEIGNDLNVNAGTLSGTNDITVNGSVKTTGTNGTVTLTGGTFTQRVGATGKTIGTNVATATNWTFNNLTFSNSSGSDLTIQTNSLGTGQLIVNGTLTIGDVADTNVTTLDAETNDRIINANGDFLITSHGGLLASSTQGLNVGGNFTNNGTFVSGTGTVTFDATTAGNIISGNITGSNSFYSVVLNGAGGGWSANSPMEVDGAFTVTAGTWSGTSDITVAGNVTGNGTTGWIMLTGGTFEQRVAAAQTFGSNVVGANNWTFNNLTFSNSSAVDRTITTNGTGTGQIVVNGTLTIGDDADTNLTILNANTNDRILNANDLLITSEGTLQSASAQTLFIGGNYTNNGTFTHDSGTVVLDATSPGMILSGTLNGLSPFYNLTFNGAGGSWANTSDMTVANAFTVTAGTVTGSGNITVAGAVTGDGTNGWILMTGGTFEQRVAAAQTFGTNVSGANDWNFYNLLFTNSSGVNRTVTMNGTGSGEIIATGGLSIGNTSDTNSTTLSNATNDRILAVGGDVNITSKGVLQASDLSLFSVGGSWTNTGTFTSNNGTVTFNSSIAGQTLSGTLGFGGVQFNGAGGSWTTNAALSVTRGLDIENGLLNDGGSQIAGNATYNLIIGANGELDLGSALTATTFPTLFAAAHISLDAGSTVTYNAGVSQNIAGTPIYGNLVLSASSGNPTKTALAALTVAGNLAIGAHNTYSVSASNFALTVGGNFDNQGQFTANNGTVTFASANTQVVRNSGGTFSTVVSSNISSGGLIFSAGFTAANLFVNTNPLGASATIYFAGNSTFTISNFILNGSAAYPLVLKSTDSNVAWYLNNTSSNAVSYARVSRSNASAGLRITDRPGGVDGGNNANWVFDVLPPGNPRFTGTSITALSAAWDLPIYPGDTYTLQVSTDQNFRGTTTSSNTASLNATTPSSLIPNTTYYGRVDTIIDGSSSPWTTNMATATLANIPAAPPLAWTAVNITSLTVTWNNNSNPVSVTRYVLDLSTGSFPNSFSGNQSSATYNLSATFSSLQEDTTYYAEVKAINHGGTSTAYLQLGSTKTVVLASPSNLHFVAAQTNFLSAAWTATSPPADTYNFQVSTASDFSGSIISSGTSNPSAASQASLSANTTYYGRVNAVVGGITSVWSPGVTTATLANVPLTVASTWTAVFTTSATVTWSGNNNPVGSTLYVIQLSSVSNFLSGDLFTDSIYGLSDTFGQLDSGVTYFARVKAVNQSGVSTAFTDLGSTKTAIAPVPKNFAFTAAAINSLSASWGASTPPGDTYTMEVSTDADFDGTQTSSNTANLSATTPLTLLANTTYYGHAHAVIGGTPGAWSTPDSTATLANPPDSAGTTWIDVQFTSITVAWSNNSNPPNMTHYVITLSSGNFPNVFSGNKSTDVFTLSTTFAGLIPSVTYFAEVQAINHSGVSTSLTDLGSTVTLSPNAPTFLWTSVQISSISVFWNSPVPSGDSYTFQASTDAAFGGSPVSSTTASLSTNIAGLTPNTTYYGRVNSVVSGSSSPWSVAQATITLANVPATIASTWTTVGLSSITLAWAANNNPPGSTLYRAELSDASDFSSNLVSSTTSSLQATLDTLLTNTVYYGRVLAINQDGTETAYLNVGSTQTLSPTVCNATATGNWSAPGTWTGCRGPGGLPAATDAITINSGVSVTLDQDAAIAGLTFAAPGTNNALTHAGTNLTVNGPVNFTQPTTSTRNNSWNINAGSATVTGLISFNGASGTTSRKSNLVITSGLLNAFGGISFTASASATKNITMSGGAGVLNLKGDLTIPANSCTLTAGTAGSVFNYMDDSAAQTVKFFTSGAYDHLYLNNTSPSGVTLGADKTAANATGDVRVQSGTFKNGGFAITGGAGDAFDVDDGATFEMSGASAFPGSFTTYTFAPTSTVRYLQTTTPLTITSQLYGNLDLMPAGTATQNFPSGTFTMAGNLTIGDGTNAATVSANANATALQIGGSVTIKTGATLVANAANLLTVAGDWTNRGAFVHNASTVSFIGTASQLVDNRGMDFGTVVSSNASAGGLVFSASCTIANLYANTGDLAAGATLYFAGGSTFSVTSLQINGTSVFPLVFKSTTPSVRWYLNNISTHSVRYVQVQDSDASLGLRILDDAGGVDLLRNTNWAIGLNPPSGPQFSVAAPTSLTLSWTAPSPSGDTYTFQISTNSGLTAPVTSSSTFNLAGSSSSLSVNTTYYARANSVIAGRPSSWSSVITTATLANPPIAAAATWTYVGFSSLSVTWVSNGNPSNVTRYVVDLSTDAGFPAGAVSSSVTTTLAASFVSLIPSATYYGRVKAVNHSGIDTAYTTLGSTVTLSPLSPSGLQFTAAQTDRLSALWNSPVPPGDSYTLQVSTAADFSGALANSNTAALSATTPANLSANTTYYGRVNAILSGSSSTWTTSVTTATLANAPISVSSTWTAIGVTSVTLAWSGNNNPSNVTLYVAQLSTVSSFASGTILQQVGTALNASFLNLDSGVIYYARVKAINHSGISTSFASLGSTQTLVVPIPANLRFTATTPTSLTAAWDASTPPADTYDLIMSTEIGFGTVASSSTANLYGTPTTALSPNTTYFAEVRAVVGGTPYAYTAYETTVTLANIPSPAGSTWTAVQFTSITVAWSNNSNPVNDTRYSVILSSGSFPNALSGNQSLEVLALSATFTGLIPNVTYYAEVKAINHSGVSTNFANLGSTRTLTPQSPAGFQTSDVQASSITAVWNITAFPADSYMLQGSTSSDFSGTPASSSTALSFATLSSLSINTTYYLRVNATLSGIVSPWSASLTTATLANAPSTAVSTWTTVTLTTVTFAWTANGNPAIVTPYVAELSDASDFVSGTTFSSATFALTATFADLLTGTTYYARVKAINRSGVETAYAVLGSTQTLAPNTCNATLTGNWSAAIWANCKGPGGLPAATDAVIINSGVTVTLDSNATVAGLTFAAPGTNNALTHSGATLLTVNGSVVFNQPTTTSRNNAWNINAGSATVVGPILFNGANNTTSRISKIVITSGQLNAFGGMTFTGSASATKVIIMSGGAGTLNLKGNLTITANSCTLTAGTAGSVFNYMDDAAAQTVRFFTSGAYNNLYFNNTSAGGVTLGADKTTLNATGDVRVQSGTFDNGGFAITGGSGDTFEVADGATFQMSGTSAFPGSFSSYTFGSNSTVRYLQTTDPLPIDSQSFGNLDLVPAGAARQNFPAGSFVIRGNLTVGDGTNAATVSADANATILQIGGSVDINAAATFVANSSNSLAISGDWTNNGVFTAGASTVTFNGSTIQTLTGSTTFYGLRQVTAGATVQFSAGSDQFVTHMVEFQNVGLRSGTDNSAWNFFYTGSSQTLKHVFVKDSDASGGLLMQADLASVNVGNNTNWDFGPPAAVSVIAAAPSAWGAAADLSWQTPGDDGPSGPLNNSTFTVQYTSNSAFAQSSSWDPLGAQPSDVYRLTIATTNLNPSTGVFTRIDSLSGGSTYYFRLWTKDDVGNYSPISLGATNYATPVDISLHMSTNTLAAGQWTPGVVVVLSTPIVVANDGNMHETYAFSATTATAGSPWHIGPTQGVDQFVLWMVVSDTQPTDTEFGSEDMLSESNTSCTGATFANSSTNCVAVPPGEQRTVWFKFGVPPAVSNGDGQIIRVTAVANVSN